MLAEDTTPSNLVDNERCLASSCIWAAFFQGPLFFLIMGVRQLPHFGDSSDKRCSRSRSLWFLVTVGGAYALFSSSYYPLVI